MAYDRENYSNSIYFNIFHALPLFPGMIISTIEYVGHIGLRSLTDGHLGRHLEYFKTINDARVASVGFIKYNASTTRINKEKNFKIKFQVNLVF